MYAATDRFDESVDMRRSIRGDNFKLIYNVDISTPVYKDGKVSKTNENYAGVGFS